jgi:hypothetical protein
VVLYAFYMARYIAITRVSKQPILPRYCDSTMMLT